MPCEAGAPQRFRSAAMTTVSEQRGPGVVGDDRPCRTRSCASRSSDHHDAATGVRPVQRSSAKLPRRLPLRVARRGPAKEPRPSSGKQIVR